MMIGRRKNILSVFEGIRPFEGPKRKVRELEQTRDVLERLSEYCEDVKLRVNSCSGLKICSDFLVPRKHVVERNITWLTSVSLLKLAKMDFSVDADDPSYYAELIHMADHIRRNIADFTPDLVEQGVLVPIPSVIEEHDEKNRESRTIDFSEQVFHVGFSSPFVLQQLTEERVTSPPPGVLEFLLPRVANVPLSEVLNLRRDLCPVFDRFQRELVAFIQNSAAVDSESKLYDLFLRVDNETRRLTSEFGRLDKQHSLERMGLAYSFGVISLVLLLPGDVFKSIAALLGTTSVLNAIKNIRLVSMERRTLEDDPFYIPYRLTELARQYAP
jgi:hypothetical protein